MKKATLVLLFWNILVALSEPVVAQTWQTYHDSADVYYEKGNFVKVAFWLEKALPITAENYQRLGKADTSYALLLNDLATTYGGLGESEKVVAMLEKACVLDKETFGETHENFLQNQSNLAAALQRIGQYQEASEIFSSILEKRARSIGKQEVRYAQTLRNLAVSYTFMGRFVEAENLLLEAISIIEKNVGNDHFEYYQAHNNLYGIYQSIGLYYKCIDLLKNNVTRAAQSHWKNKPIFASMLSNLAGSYFFHYYDSLTVGSPQFNYIDSVTTEVVKMRERTMGASSYEYGTAIQQKAKFYARFNMKPDTVGKYLLRNLIINQSLGKQGATYANALTSYALHLRHLGQYERTDSLIKANLLKFNKFLVRSQVLSVYVANIIAMRRYKEADLLFKEYLADVINSRRIAFVMLSESEKQISNKRFSSHFKVFNAYTLQQYKRNPLLAGEMYNYQLASKMLMSDVSNKLRNHVFNTKDSTLIRDYQTWLIKKNILANSYAQSNKKVLNTDSILGIVEGLERKIARRSSLFASLNQKPETWQMIQKGLKKNEAAVEIIRVTHYNFDSAAHFTDNISYLALILTPKTHKHPILVELNNGRELDGKYLNYYKNVIEHRQTDDHSYSQYWERIKNALPADTRTLYFSPDGVYNQINLNVIPNPTTGKYIIDEIDLRTLTTTRDLLRLNAAANPHNTMALFGYPDYKMDSQKRDMMLTINKLNSQPFLAYNTSRSSEKELQELPATLEEVRKIEVLAQKEHWQKQVFTGENALEENLKQVKNPKVLHIATHGFFGKTNDDKTYFSNDNFLINSLLESGLMLAGASETLDENRKKNKETPRVDDGVLSAYEATNLQLDSTDLVVLSACETGLGKVQNGDGVYGLQRAFKVAGAKSLIMSLWKVNDQTTQELMVLFYEKWLAGQDKQKAFKAAQSELRQRYPSPYYWGAFIMLE